MSETSIVGRRKGESHDQCILRAMVKAGPCSLELLHFVTKIPKSRLCKRLKKLADRGYIKKVTEKVTPFWVVGGSA